MKDHFDNWSTVIFAIVYHDAIYNPRNNNNEEKSAALALERLKSIDVPEHLTDKCTQFILATKKHEASDHETNLFTDADLAILGSDSLKLLVEMLEPMKAEYSTHAAAAVVCSCKVKNSWKSTRTNSSSTWVVKSMLRR